MIGAISSWLQSVAYQRHMNALMEKQAMDHYEAYRTELARTVAPDNGIRQEAHQGVVIEGKAVRRGGKPQPSLT